MLQETVKLDVGVEIDGQRYDRAVLREALVADTLRAEKKADGKSVVYFSLVLLGEQIVELRGHTRDEATGDVEVVTYPGEKVGIDTLGLLTEEDTERLQAARDVLKKKAKWSPRD